MSDSKELKSFNELHDDPQCLTLSSIREKLIRLEETIVFALIERAQFPHNAPVYQTGAKSLINANESAPDNHKSFLDYMFEQTEKLHGSVSRYTSLEEHAFFPHSQTPLPMSRPVSSATNETLTQTPALYPNNINVNAKIMSMYKNQLLPELTREGDDGNYGSAAVCDITLLQALSKRIHYGKFVAEAKFQAERAEYTKLILNNDQDAIMKLLTKPEIEKQVCMRVRLKAERYGSSPTGKKNTLEFKGIEEGGVFKVSPLLLESLYRKWVMPLTKEVEVLYLLRRLGPIRLSIFNHQGCVEARNVMVGKTTSMLGNVLESKNEVAATQDIQADLETVFVKLESNEAAYGLVPIEIAGSSCYTDTLHLMLRFQHLCVVGQLLVGSPLSRVFILSKFPAVSSGNDSSVLCFGLKAQVTKPGMLNQALKLLEKSSVNLTLIHSITDPSTHRYYFYLEVEGFFQDDNIVNAVEELKTMDTIDFVRVLGSYEN